MTTPATASLTSPLPASAFFARWADMSTWSDWNVDTEWVRLDGPFIEGATGVLKPQGGPQVPFLITRLDEHAFVDESRLFGARLVCAHVVSPVEEGTRVDVTVTLTGPLAAAWRVILGGGIVRTLRQDLDSLVVAAGTNSHR
jgi:hypothetical protein